MIDRPLRSIRLANFRSIPGDIRLPLDAQVILVHGPNGSGKTSILSGIELALTGEVESLARLDDHYFAHLPHHGEDFAAVEIEVADEAGSVQRHNMMTVGPSGLKGSPALEGARRRFYSERSYLDQFSLGRLLEIYQHTETNQESSLERFVNELLGLDELDALIEGLDDTLDIRRLRKTVDRFAEAERNQASLASQRKELTSQLRNMSDSIETQESQLAEMLNDLTLVEFGASELLTPDSLAEHVDAAQLSDRRSQAVAAVDQLTELRGRLMSIEARPSQARLQEALELRDEAKVQLDSWWTEHQASISELLSVAQSLNLAVGDQKSEPAQLLDLRAELSLELEQSEASLRQHQAATEDTATIQQELETARLRLLSTSSEIDNLEASVGTLATGLSALMEHVDGEICPVCDRDFSEMPGGGLRSHLAAKVDRIAEQGDELRARREERSGLERQTGELERRIDLVNRSVLPDVEFERTKDRLSRLQALGADLESATRWLLEGVDAQGRLRESEANVIDGEQASQEREEVGRGIAELGGQLNIDISGRTTSDALEVLLNTARDQVSAYASQQATYTAAIDLAAQLQEKRSELAESTKTIAALTYRQDELDAQIEMAKKRRDSARSVHTAALDERSDIIRRVFTQSLNKVWRDVFVRLAPDEVFVPAFGLPQAGRRSVSFDLQTIHRSGQIGGSPGAMLSAGNLNTAALSLFISLHLAVEPTVPCLVFDDPVQSMDEVHVAQFAALIRTLSKQLSRQVVIAVHERELFDYLCLELSPAFQNDRLITIQLGSQTSSSREPFVELIDFKPDLAVAM